MEAIKFAAEASGWKVIGFAPSDQAREALTSSGVKAETVQLVTKDQKFWAQVNSKTLLIVDEAGMVDAGEMRILLEKAEKAGARVQLVGDRKQLQSVGAGMAYARIATQAKTDGALVELTEMNRARTKENKSLHVLSRDDQVAALNKMMNPNIYVGDKAILQDIDGKTVVHIGGSAPHAQTLEISAQQSAALAGIPRGVTLKVSGSEGASLVLSDSKGKQATVILKDGGPAGRVFSSGDSEERYEFIANSYARLSESERHKTPIIVDTNVDLNGVTAAIRKKLNVKSVFTAKTFESRNIEIARHLSSTAYSVGDAIKINTTGSKGESFTKGEILTVLSIEPDKLRVRSSKGHETTFTPSRHGQLGTLGGVGSCELAVGDVVRFTAKWSQGDNKIRNGDRGVIKSIDATGKAEVQFMDWDGKRLDTKTLNLGDGPIGIRLGYAATVHALQGGTMDKGYYLASSTSRNSFLVGATRFKQGFTLVADIETKDKLKSLAVSIQTAQHKESALPSKDDLAHQHRKPVMNSVWPADKKRARNQDGHLNFSSFSPQVPMTEENVYQFLKRAKGELDLGNDFIVDGNPTFIALATHIAKTRGLDIIVKSSTESIVQAAPKSQGAQRSAGGKESNSIAAVIIPVKGGMNIVMPDTPKAQEVARGVANEEGLLTVVPSSSPKSGRRTTEITEGQLDLILTADSKPSAKTQTTTSTTSDPATTRKPGIEASL
jgi:hypothetical protein